MTDDENIEVTPRGSVVLGSNRQVEGTLIVPLLAERQDAAFLIGKIPIVTEVDILFGSEYNFMATMKGDARSLAEAIIQIGLLERAEVKKIYDCSRNNGSPIKELTIEEIESRGSVLKCAGLSQE